MSAEARVPRGSGRRTGDPEARRQGNGRPLLLGRSIEIASVARGAGFAAFARRLAGRAGVSGRLRLAGGAVEIHAEGAPEGLDRFCAALARDAPPAALVQGVTWRQARPAGLDGFVIEAADEDRPDGEVRPHLAPCGRCLREILDRRSRRFGYPFVACPDCGSGQHDRAGTGAVTEAGTRLGASSRTRTGAMCEACRAEYGDPGDRRFRFEGTSCPACGPILMLLDPDGHPLEGDPIEAAAKLLVGGSIVAAKGPGGYHVVCDGTDEATVLLLRERLSRPDEPLPLLVEDLEHAREMFPVSVGDQILLESERAPSVILEGPKRPVPALAPGLHRLAVRLPSTGLEHLLVRATGRPLAWATGSVAGEPTCTSDEEARDRLAPAADAFLVHDREVAAPCGESVVRDRAGRGVVMRRGRGLAAEPIPLAIEARPSLGLGVARRAAFCLAANDRAFVSQDIGRLESAAAVGAYRAALERWRSVSGIEPEVVAHDLEVDLLAARLPRAIGVPEVAVQHHHAHVAAVMAEHRLEGRVIGVAFDDAGRGADGTAWGGEFLICDAGAAERAGHLRPVPQPRDRAAVRHPARTGFAQALDAGVLDEAARLLGTTHRAAESLRREAAAPGRWAPTGSAGRLFDAVAALCGVCTESTYPAHAAMLLEDAADPSATAELPFELEEEGGRVVVDTRPLIESVVRARLRGHSAAEVSGRFHRTLAAAVVSVCRILRGRTGLGRVCLAGGTFQNALLASDVASRLAACEFEVFVPQRIPVDDGGLALGQVLVANARLAGR